MSRKLRWAPTSVPYLRRGLAMDAETEVARFQGALQRPDAPAGEAARWMSADLDMWAELAERLRLAELFWVTGDMARVAMDAARDVPVITTHDMPSANGLMVFANSLPAFPTDAIGGLMLLDGASFVEHRDPVPVDALMWMRKPEGLEARLMTRAQNLPHPLTAHDGELVVFMRVMLARIPIDVDDIPSSHSRALYALLAAAWHLMGIPTLAERRVLDAEWGGKATSQTRPDQLVTTIDLRPLRHVSTDDDRSDDPDRRRLTVRHYVRGHWRNQAVGPNHSERRLTYVAPYIKGPEWAPLKFTEKVMVWRR